MTSAPDLSRSVPRGQSPGYRRLKELEPGVWFNSVTPVEYHKRFMAQLARLDARTILAKIELFAAGHDVALLCFEDPLDPNQWCHRGQVSAWLQDELALDVPEFRR